MMTIIVHANKEVHCGDFFIRAGGEILLSPTMRAKMRRMTPAHDPQYLHIPLSKWSSAGDVAVRATPIEVIDYNETGKTPFSPFIQFIKTILGENLIGAEVGVFEGYNADRLLRNLPIKTLYLIDPYASNDAYVVNATHSAELTRAEAFAKERLEPFSDRVIWVRQKAVEAVSLFDDGMLDFIYLDGDKGYENFSRELELYIPKVRPAGIFGGHDYTNTYMNMPINEIKTVVDRYTIMRNIPSLYHSNEFLQWWWYNV